MAKKLLWVLGALAVSACVATAGGIVYGNNESDYANDGECDDPRFTGGGMAYNLTTDNIGKDANDCRALHQSQRIRAARTQEQWELSQCSAIDYGSNSSQWARDAQCDDPRFTGPGTDEILLGEDLRADAADCRALCAAGEVWLK